MNPAELPEPVPSPQANPESQAMAHEVSRVLEKAVEQLAPAYRLVFILREVEGLSTSDTAAALRLSEDNVKQRLHRAKGQLRDSLFAQAGDHIREVLPFQATRCDRVVAAVLKDILSGDVT